MLDTGYSMLDNGSTLIFSSSIEHPASRIESNLGYKNLLPRKDYFFVRNF